VIETFDETHHRRREVIRTIRDGIKETILWYVRYLWYGLTKIFNNSNTL
jgi:hypothetical protein